MSVAIDILYLESNICNSGLIVCRQGSKWLAIIGLHEYVHGLGYADVIHEYSRI